MLAALVHRVLQQADGHLRAAGGGWRKAACRAQRRRGPACNMRPAPAGSLQPTPRQLCCRQARGSSSGAPAQRLPPLLTWLGTIWPCLIMSATICPSGLPLFMCARSRSPALRGGGGKWHSTRADERWVAAGALGCTGSCHSCCRPALTKLQAAPSRPSTQRPPEVRHAKLLHEPRALRALAAAGAAQDEDDAVAAGVVGRLGRRRLGRRGQLLGGGSKKVWR